ncbi:hypothetical protein E1286_20830 [Nonomuraea terrae]|uniref:Uncharacterized protein n=1 Tax=Nonomuraea terrae TaxID=2530383 RepID=A0A4R4YQJ9_9ACTN|nr:hypothetical protein [Nonomuraea terrae]TDD46429.1 hypothetical protein E1286_20830 [Nonomuraea terrae]
MAERYYRRGHWVNKPRRKSRKGAGWAMPAVAVVAAWVAVQAVGSEAPAPAPTEQVAPAGVPAQQAPTEQVAPAQQAPHP